MRQLRELLVAALAPCAGGMASAAENADYWWKPGNDFVGDPPQEERGLYSVFDSDVTSLLLIKEYADKLHAIKKSAGVPAAAPTTPSGCR